MNMGKQDIIKRMEALSKEYNGLTEKLLNPEMMDSVEHHYHEIVSKLHNEEECEASIVGLKTENRNCKKEIRFLKDQLKRCNLLLNRYVCKDEDGLLASSDDLFSAELEHAPMPRQCVYKLHSLLVAYDEVFAEQESNIQELSAALENSLKKMKVLEEENTKFYNYFEAFGDEASNNKEFRQVAEDAKLLIEGRELLLKEIELIQRKETQNKIAHNNRIKELESSFAHEKSTSTFLSEELKLNRIELEKYQKEIEILQEELKYSVAADEHKKSVEKCSNYLEKLKTVYGNESSKMKKSVSEIGEEKKSMEEQLNISSEKVCGMKMEVNGCRRHLRKNYSLLVRQRKLIHSLRISKKNFLIKLRNISRICSNLLDDRKKLLSQMRDLRKESNKYMLEATKKSESLGKLTLKMKEVRLAMRQDLAESEGKRKAVEEAWTNSTRDVQRLRKLLHGKDEYNQALISNFK